MRVALAAGLVTLLFSTACAPVPAAPPPAPNAGATPAATSGPPSWLPVYTAAQLDLLKPVSQAIRAPAERIFPDLERFGYANSRPLSNLEEALRFTHMVTKILRDSPRFYSLEEASRELANPVVQYGPPAAEPDGFKVTRRRADGPGDLVDAVITADARAAHDRGVALAAARDFAGAAASHRKASQKSPRVPALRVALGAALAGAGDVNGAIAAYADAIEIDPTFAPAHFALAELALGRGDAMSAKRELAEGLAYHPSSPSGRALAVRAGGRRAGAQGRLPFAIFLDVDAGGAIHVAAPRSGPSQVYGGCRAIMRFEPEVRAHIFEQPRGTPYYLSVVEEVVCLEAALGAYMVERVDDGTPDPALDGLLRLAREEGLSGYAMFEILGQHRPERARVAPPEVHRALVTYVERHVLEQREPSAEGVYSAAR